MPNANTDRQSLDRLFAKANELLSAPGTASPTELADVLDAIHSAHGDEKEKLRRKDQLLVLGIAAVGQDIDRQDYLPQGTARTLRAILGLLVVIEAILWELKKLPGEMPKPQPPQPPTPTKPPRT